MHTFHEFQNSVHLLLTWRYVVEIKRRREIPAGIIEEVKSKIDRLPLRRGLSVRTALVYDGELAPSVIRRGWFDFLVPADTLLGQ